MTLEMILALAFVVFLVGLGGATLLAVFRMASYATSTAKIEDADPEPAQAPAETQAEAAPQAADPVVPAPKAEATGDEPSEPTLLPFSTPLPPFSSYPPIDYSEDEDDVPTTLYQADEDGEYGFIADFED